MSAPSQSTRLCASRSLVSATLAPPLPMHCCSVVLRPRSFSIDANHAKAEGEAMDLNHAVPFAHPTRIWAGDYSDCAGAAVIVLAAGANKKPGETRLDLPRRMPRSGKQIVPKVFSTIPKGFC